MSFAERLGLGGAEAVSPALPGTRFWPALRRGSPFSVKLSGSARDTARAVSKPESAANCQESSDRSSDGASGERTDGCSADWSRERPSARSSADLSAVSSSGGTWDCSGVRCFRAGRGEGCSGGGAVGAEGDGGGDGEGGAEGEGADGKGGVGGVDCDGWEGSV